MVSAGTVEERIVQRAEKKLYLDQVVHYTYDVHGAVKTMPTLKKKSGNGSGAAADGGGPAGAAEAGVEVSENGQAEVAAEDGFTAPVSKPSHKELMAAIKFGANAVYRLKGAQDEGPKRRRTEGGPSSSSQEDDGDGEDDEAGSRRVTMMLDADIDRLIDRSQLVSLAVRAAADDAAGDAVGDAAGDGAAAEIVDAAVRQGTREGGEEQADGEQRGNDRVPLTAGGSNSATPSPQLLDGERGGGAGGAGVDAAGADAKAKTGTEIGLTAGLEVGAEQTVADFQPKMEMLDTHTLQGQTYRSRKQVDKEQEKMAKGSKRKGRSQDDLTWGMNDVRSPSGRVRNGVGGHDSDGDAGDDALGKRARKSRVVQLGGVSVLRRDMDEAKFKMEAEEAAAVKRKENAAEKEARIQRQARGLGDRATTGVGIVTPIGGHSVDLSKTSGRQLAGRDFSNQRFCLVCMETFTEDETWPGRAPAAAAALAAALATKAADLAAERAAWIVRIAYFGWHQGMQSWWECRYQLARSGGGEDVKIEGGGGDSDGGDGGSSTRTTAQLPIAGDFAGIAEAASCAAGGGLGKHSLGMSRAVSAAYGGGGVWYPGTVVKDSGDGTYDIAYDDGDEDKGLLWCYVYPRDGRAHRGLEGVRAVKSDSAAERMDMAEGTLEGRARRKRKCTIEALGKGRGLLSPRMGTMQQVGSSLSGVGKKTKKELEEEEKSDAGDHTNGETNEKIDMGGLLTKGPRAAVAPHIKKRVELCTENSSTGEYMSVREALRVPLNDSRGKVVLYKLGDLRYDLERKFLVLLIEGKVKVEGAVEGAVESAGELAWAQCSKCDKWRQLAPGKEEWGGDFYCPDVTWDVNYNDCSKPQDPAANEDDEDGNVTQTAVAKQPNAVAKMKTEVVVTGSETSGGFEVACAAEVKLEAPPYPVHDPIHAAAVSLIATEVALRASNAAAESLALAEAPLAVLKANAHAAVVAAWAAMEAEAECENALAAIWEFRQGTTETATAIVRAARNISETVAKAPVIRCSQCPLAVHLCCLPLQYHPTDDETGVPLWAQRAFKRWGCPRHACRSGVLCTLCNRDHHSLITFAAAVCARRSLAKQAVCSSGVQRAHPLSARTTFLEALSRYCALLMPHYVIT
jgi:hypothetical protein